MDRNKKKLNGILKQCLNVLKHAPHTNVFQNNIKKKLETL